jgi:hypothetical protein
MDRDSSASSKYLPIGSVVLLVNGNKRVMIYGRRQQQVSNGTIWDYVACLYPEGNITENETYLFNHDQIQQIYHIGYIDEDEKQYLAMLESVDHSSSMC